MTAFYTSLRTHEIHHLRNLLEAAGIRCHVRNEGLSTLAGEVPFVECAMQLWLENESDRDFAETILREMTSQEVRTGPGWICPRCNEHVEPQFTACWNCGAGRH